MKCISQWINVCKLELKNKIFIHILIKIAQSLSPLSMIYSKTLTPILMKLCMWPRHVPRKVLVPLTPLVIARFKRKAAGGRLSMRVIYNTSIIKQNRAKTSMTYFERASSSKIFFEQYRVRAFFEQYFFEQFRVRVLSSSQIFERAEQNLEQTAAQSQH